jgi:hypothetical protein
MLAIVLICGLFGCSTVKENEVLKIRLQCADLCKNQEHSLFNEKVITDVNEIKVFTEAIKKAKPINGILDYGAVFKVFVSFKDKTEKQYVLNITENENEDPLLVNMSESEKGYTIPKKNADELRAIIYKQ